MSVKIPPLAISKRAALAAVGGKKAWDILESEFPDQLTPAIIDNNWHVYDVKALQEAITAARLNNVRARQTSRKP